MAGRPYSMTTVRWPLLRRPMADQRSDLRDRNHHQERTPVTSIHVSLSATLIWHHARGCVCVCVCVCMCNVYLYSSLRVVILVLSYTFLSPLFYDHPTFAPDIRWFIHHSLACRHLPFSTVVPSSHQSPSSLDSVYLASGPLSLYTAISVPSLPHHPN